MSGIGDSAASIYSGPTMKNRLRHLMLFVCFAMMGCASPTWQIDTSPDADVAIIYSKLNPMIFILTVNGEGKGPGFVSQIRLPNRPQIERSLKRSLYVKKSETSALRFARPWVHGFRIKRLVTRYEKTWNALKTGT